MASDTDHANVLGRIAELAAQAAARPDLPGTLKPILTEIAALAKGETGDSPEPSDIPQTESQSL